MDYSKYLLVSDIDGTVLVAGKPVPQINIDAINNFINKGGRFTICTGRGSKSASAFTNLINLKEPAIICNGTCVFDYIKNEVIFAQTLPVKAKKIVIDFIDKFKETGVEVVKEPFVYICNMSEAAKNHLAHRNMQYELKNIDEIEDGISKVVFICDLENKQDIDAYLKDVLKDDKEVSAIWTNEHLVELVPANASKAIGLSKLCEAIYVSKDNVIAVGDYYNDIELLNAAKVKVVVGNAPQELKDMADLVVSNCLDGGLAEVLNNFEEIVSKFIEGE